MCYDRVYPSLDWTTRLSYFPFLDKFLCLFLESTLHIVMIVIMVVCSCLLQCFSISAIIMYGMYIRICISYNTGKSLLPDIHTTPEGECVYIRQSTSACVITNMLYFRHSKNLPKLEGKCSAALCSNRCGL